jgi:transposase
LYHNSSNHVHGNGESDAPVVGISSVTSDVARSATPPASDPEVVAGTKRVRRTAAYKLRMIVAADACEHRGDLGALLRSAGIYHSDLANWRKQKANGQLGGSPASRSRRSDPAFQEALKQQAELARENRELRRQLGRAKTIIEIQKKAAHLLGETLQEMSLDDPPQSDIESLQ